MKIGIDYKKDNKKHNKNIEYDDTSIRKDKHRTEEDEDYDIVENNSGSNKNKIIIVAIGCILLILVVILFYLNVNSNDTSIINGQDKTESNSDYSDNTEISNDIGHQVYDENGELISNDGVYDLEGNILDKSNEDLINPGNTNYVENENNQTTAKVYSSSDFIKDLNGVDIPAIYKVKEYNYVEDFVNYEKRRATMDDGMDLYWLEVVYQGKHYRCTVPFWRFKALRTEGICMVKIEVLTLEGGEKVISYMNVIDNPTTSSNE